jgi:hypothetical protein
MDESFEGQVLILEMKEVNAKRLKGCCCSEFRCMYERKEREGGERREDIEDVICSRLSIHASLYA